MKHIFKVGLCAVALLSACAPVTLLNTITPSGSFSKAKDVSYGDHSRQVLDVYTPDAPKSGAPIIVYVHGGSWSEGSKNDYKFLSESFTSEGYTVVVPNYRLYPDALFPDFVVDTAKALKWTADKYPNKPLILMGHSAGGYNALMTAMDPQFFNAEGGDICTTVSGVVSLAAPTGIIPLGEEPYITIFPDRLSKADAPLNHTEGPVPPMFLMNGEDDKTVYPQNSIRLAEKLTVRGGEAKAHIYPKLNHIDAVKVLSRYFDGDSTLEADILAFIESHSTQKDNYCK